MSPQPSKILQNPTKTISKNVTPGDCTIILAYLYGKSYLSKQWSWCAFWLLPSTQEVLGSIPVPCAHAASTFFLHPPTVPSSLFSFSFKRGGFINLSHIRVKINPLTILKGKMQITGLFQKLEHPPKKKRKKKMTTSIFSVENLGIQRGWISTLKDRNYKNCKEELRIPNFQCQKQYKN